MTVYDKYNSRVFINLRESMVHKILSTTCTNGNTFEERETTFYVCKYKYINVKCISYINICIKSYKHGKKIYIYTHTHTYIYTIKLFFCKILYKVNNKLKDNEP